MAFRHLLYPVLRLLRRTLFLLTPKRISSYNSADLASRILSADLRNLKGGTSFGCQLWQLSIANRTNLKVLDFGGGSGRCGFERLGADGLAWAVVETPEMSKAAKGLFVSPGLMFFESIEQAKESLGRVDVVHVSSALQYSDNPRLTLAALLDTDPEIVVFEKTVVTNKTTQKFRQYSFLQDNLTGNLSGDKLLLGAVRYWLTAENLDEILGVLDQYGYTVMERWEDPVQSHLPYGKGLRQLGLVAKNPGTFSSSGCSED